MYASEMNESLGPIDMLWRFCIEVLFLRKYVFTSDNSNAMAMDGKVEPFSMHLMCTRVDFNKHNILLAQ